MDFVQLLRGVGDIDTIEFDPLRMWARLPGSPETLIPVLLDCDEVLRRYPRLSSMRADFLDEAMTLVRGPGGQFGRNLDAFEDYVTGGRDDFGGDIQFIWNHSELSRRAMGHEATARRLREGYPKAVFINRRLHRQAQIAAENGRGPTDFDNIVAVFDENDVIVVLR